jgi:hypothetical protein
MYNDKLILTILDEIWMVMDQLQPSYTNLLIYNHFYNEFHPWMKKPFVWIVSYITDEIYPWQWNKKHEISCVYIYYNQFIHISQYILESTSVPPRTPYGDNISCINTNIGPQSYDKALNNKNKSILISNLHVICMFTSNGHTDFEKQHKNQTKMNKDH